MNYSWRATPWRCSAPSGCRWKDLVVELKWNPHLFAIYHEILMMSCPREGALHPLNVDEGPGDRVHIKSVLLSLHTTKYCWRAAPWRCCALPGWPYQYTHPPFSQHIMKYFADELPPEGAVLPLDGDEGAGDGVRLQDTGHAHRR